MRFLRFGGGTVELGVPVLEVLKRHRQMNSNADEAGGILLGRLISETADFVVDRASEPSSTDRKGRFFFFRPKRHAQQQVAAAWRESNSTLNYLGEWHTHPEGDPTPSRTDTKNWKRIGRKARYEQECLVFVIVGKQRTRMWEFCKSNGEVHELDSFESRQSPTSRM